MTLQLKRALAFAAIAALVVALEGCCSQLARLGIGLSLLASLFSSNASSLSFLIGSGVGYTHGAELNAFVFVVSAVACLVAWARTRRLEEQKRSLLFLGTGLFCCQLVAISVPARCCCCRSWSAWLSWRRPAPWARPVGLPRSWH